VEKATADFAPQRPDKIAPLLAKGLQQTQSLIADIEQSKLSVEEKYNVLHELHVKECQFNDAIVTALQLSLNADVVPSGPVNTMMAEFRGVSPTFEMATPDKQFNVKIHLYQASSEPLLLEKVGLISSSGKDWNIKAPPSPTQLESQKAADLLYTVKVPADEPFTRPYFTREGLQDAYYHVSHGAPLNASQASYPLYAEANFSYNGVNIGLASVVQVVSKINGPGTLRYPMPLGPAISVAMSPSAGVIPLDAKSTRVSVRVHNNAEGKVESIVHLVLPKGWSSEPSSLPVLLTQTGEEQTVSFAIVPKVEEGKSYTITAVADYAGQQFKEGYAKAGYTGLRPYFLYSPATYTAIGTDVKMAPGENIAYIEGSGDDVPASLLALGVHVVYLSPEDVATADLGKYDAIVIGVRAYAVRPDLVANNARLLKYVEGGGVAIVQYNTPEYDHNYGPYPYVMSSDPEEVTNERSVVKILDPQNPVFTWPNKITSKDFEGWVEERGSKFLVSWDAKYEPLLETHDDKQPEQKGGLVYARYGKGVYIYNAYAFYRQLPLGVPGAFRLFANMLSLPKNPELR
jgi:hypothetical protein